MKKIYQFIFLFLITTSLWSQENYKDILKRKMEIEKYEYSKVFNENKILILEYQETFFLNNRILQEKLYTDGRNAHIYVFEENSIFMELLIKDGTIWEIKENKKKCIEKNEVIDSCFSFWWNFVNPEEIVNFYEIGEMYFCENKEQNYKFLFDKNYELRQLEIFSNNSIIRYKINKNFFIGEYKIPFSENSIIYLDSIAIKQSALTNYSWEDYSDEIFSEEKYKNFSFFDSITEFIKNNRNNK